MCQTARAVLREIEQDLRGAYASGSSYDTGLIGTDDGDDEIPLDGIELLTVNNREPLPVEGEEEQQTLESEEEPRMIDLSRVTYFVDEEEGLMRRRIRLLRKPVVGLDDEEQSEPVGEGVIGLNLRYFDGDWKEVWDSTKSRTLPQAVEITIVLYDERYAGGLGELERYTTRFFLPLWKAPPETEEQTGETGR
jgi:hypothetical protein